MILPQPLLLAFCLLFPTILLYVRKRHDILVIWLALVCTVDIFNSQQYMNLTALKLFGAIALPYLILNRKQLWNLWAVKVLAIYFLYLCLVGLWFGHIFPWHDPTGFKSGRDIPQWRSIIHLGSFFLEAMAVLYLSLHLRDEKNKKNVAFTIIIGAATSSLAAIVEQFTQYNFYTFFTGHIMTFVPERVHGFNYEPRGLSQIASYGILVFFCLLGYVKRQTYFLLFLMPLMILAGFCYNISMTGVITLFVGLVIILLARLKFLLTHLFKRTSLITVLILAIVVSGSLYWISEKRLHSYYVHYDARDYLVRSQTLTEKLEVFDAAAVNFFAQNSKYSIFGAGPGLVSIPSSAYILKRDQGAWPNGITALPHMGAILQFSNGGFLGLAIWLYFFFVIIRENLRKQTLGDIQPYPLITILCLLLYLLQIRYLFLVGLGMGLSTFANKNDK
ncbi:MAG: hypothetical protein A2X86_12310 [Bdellovibrionales bacterium GWA2_49_15]|nr:MAG: hypothetical protein A2X86_12310 [Bdellovibrionales bacterium GWA2_49_15]